MSEMKRTICINPITASLIFFTFLFSSPVNAFSAGQSEGIDFAGRGMFKEARDVFNRAVEGVPGDSLSRSALGMLDDFDSGKVKKDCLLFLFRGLGLLTQGLPEQAIEEFRLAEKSFPGYPRTHNILGMAYTITGNFPEAESQFKQAIKLQPGYAQACFNLGSFYQSQGKNSQALEYYGKAAMLEPSSADTHMNMGYIYAGEGNYENAILSFQKALGLDAYDADAYYGLGMVYFMSEQYWKSRQNFVKARGIFQKRGDREGGGKTDKYLDKFF